MILSIDIECFSTVDIKCGVYRYAEGAEIILFAYSVDGSPVTVIDLTAGECIPAEIVEMIKSPNVIKTAYNANFERVLLSHHLGIYYLDPSSWRCTMVHSAYLGLPFSLAQCGEVLKLDKQKMTEGKELIRLFCVPDKEGNRRLPKDYPEEWETFKKYNARDVEVEMQIHDRLSKYPVPEHVWEEYALDQRINDRGVLIDEGLVRSAIELSEGEEERIFEALRGLTGVENPRSVMQFSDWLKTQGIETTSLDKAAVEELLKEAEEPARTALIMRKGLTKSSVKKYEAMQKAKCKDGRIRGMFMFYGAQRTGRFAGRVVQLQNLKRNSLPELLDARELVKQKSDILPVIYPSVADVLSELVRTALIPRPGKKFVVADFSSIEARALSYLAGERWKVEAFHRGEDIYCTTASRMFGVPVVKHGVNGDLRQKGKISELACIAEGEIVLTDAGLVPIQNVTGWMKVWDGEEWVSHAGVLYKGEKTVYDHDGLAATKDHLVLRNGKFVPHGEGGKEYVTHVYDILHAGKNHRYMVNAEIVHNCGYGGSVGALKSMGALKMGLKEDELQPLVDQWRAANPHIVNYWYEVDRAAKTAIKERVTTRVGNVSFTCQSGMLFIHLPSGRSLSYVKPGIGENRFGGESITYYGLDTQKHWSKLESYGAKLVENITQAICRDILCYAMNTLKNYDIVAHVHDEVIIEADKDTSVEEVCELMSQTPDWIKGLELTADGYECDFYKKD